MGEVQLTMFGEQLAAALLTPLLWLLVCKAIRAMRKRPGVRYIIASALALATCVALPNGTAPIGLIAGAIALAILYILYKRALKQHSFETSTIISYENYDIF